MKLKQKIKDFLLWSQKYIRTDMVYVVKGGFWWIVSEIGVLVLSFLTLIAFSHWVSKEVFGAYQYILSVIAILGLFALPGMQSALVRAVAKGKEGMLWSSAKTKFKWALIGIGVCLAISGWYFLHHNFILGSSFLIASFLFPIPRISNLLFNFWQGRKRFDLQAKYSIIINILEAAIFIPVLFFTNNLIIILLAYFLSRSLFRALFFKITLNKIKNQETDNETLSLGKHLTLMQSIALFGGQIDKVIIWQFLGPVSVAIYSFSQIPLQRIQGLIPIAPLALPKLSEKNVKEIKKGVWRKFLKLFLFSVPLTFFLILIAPLIYKILFPQYLASIPYFQTLALSLVLIPFSLLGTSLLAEMKKRELYITSFVVPSLKIVLFLALIPFYKIWGIVFAILIAQVFGSLLTLYFFKKI
jgi:O-antigen/teichoic acid export membrane protein